MLLATPRHMFAAFGPEEVAALCGSFPASLPGSPPSGELRVLPESAEDLPEAHRAVLTDALAKASSEAAGYLTARYPLFGERELPSGSVMPPALIAAVCDMARYRLVGAGVQQTDPIAARYEQALAWLRTLAEGKAVLTGLEDVRSSRATIPAFNSEARRWAQPFPNSDESV